MEQKWGRKVDDHTYNNSYSQTNQKQMEQNCQMEQYEGQKENKNGQMD